MPRARKIILNTPHAPDSGTPPTNGHENTYAAATTPAYGSDAPDNSKLLSEASDSGPDGRNPDGEEEEEEEEEDEDPEPGVSVPNPEPPPAKRKRGRPPRTSVVYATPTKASTPSAGGDADEADPQKNLSTANPSISSKKRRGRPPVRTSFKSRGGPSHVTAVPLDKDGNPQRVENDEIVLPPDASGECKVDIDGHLQGGREYRCRTFTIKGRGEKLYMLSTEPARCIGFRDSYLFFQKHKQLFKIIMDDDEKYDMIARSLIPHSYKGRAIGVVTARSVFREFGARIIVGGRRIIDDYWEAKARAEGAIEGELADPDDKIPPGGLKEYNRNQYVAWHGASSVYHTGQPSVPLQMQSERHQGRMREKMLLSGVSGGVGGPGSRGGAGGRTTVITDENWMLEHAKASSSYNSDLRADREKIAEQGFYEPHTNLMFYPEITQSTRAKWEMVEAEDFIGPGAKVTRHLPRGIYTVTHSIQSPSGWAPAYPYHGVPYSGQGIRDLPEDILESLRNCFGEELVSKVKEQAAEEREWEESWKKVTSSGQG